MALLHLPKGGLVWSGQRQMCHLCGWLKLFLKKCGGEKNKKHRVGLSVVLLAVPFEYGLYVFVHLSKWFVFIFMFKFWSVCRFWNGRPTIGYNVEYLRRQGIHCSSARYKCSIENIKLKLTTKSQIYNVSPNYCSYLYIADV